MKQHNREIDEDFKSKITNFYESLNLRFKNFSKKFMINSFNYETEEVTNKLSEIILITKNPFSIIGEFLYEELVKDREASGEV